MSRVSYVDDEPRRRRRDDQGVREAINALPARSAPRRGIEREDIVESGLRRQPGHAPPAARHRPGGAGRRALRAGDIRRADPRAREIGLDAAPRRAALHPALHRRPCRRRRRRRRPVGGAAPGRGRDDADRRCRHQRRDPAGQPTGVLACSSPTGPAFEGAQIASGQRAAPGAIERVEIDPETRSRASASSAASCGPTSRLRRGDRRDRRHRHLRLGHHRGDRRDAHGRADRRGRLPSARPRRPAPAHASPTGAPISTCCTMAEDGPRIAVTQNDIRAIQLAKAALYAGARLLMDERASRASTAWCWPAPSARISRPSTRWCSA
jgi:hypothetical protein